uniref:Sodium-coupled monocarboxylate transporter 1 n=1 Tax=Arion vulgaris TaxID=1028688 RepID=A0A0B6ZWN2_9EUPU
MARHYFHYGDFIVFGATIVISIAIGIYYAFSGGRQRTTSEYLVGGRTMSFIPVAISLMASFESSIMMLGLPAEAYVYGIQYIFSSLGFLVSQLLSIHIVVPLLHPLKITSAYEYLELRFQSRMVRLVGTLLGMLTYLWYMGIVLFGPAVALEAVTGFPLWSSIFIIELVAVIYTAFGGLKAVIWTDVFQAFIMFAGIFSILIKGTIDAGGPKAVWDVAYRGGRLNFFNFDPDPRTRHTFWSLFVGSIIRGFGLGFNQSTVQRISSTRTQSEARKMLFSVAPCFSASLMLASYEGVVAYSYYQKKRCDPFESKQLTDPNQIIPYMVMDIFEHLPGMPGLFLASLFSASLSTLSSGLSSLSALLWADIVQPILGPNVSETKATIIAKLAVFVFGAIACGIAVLVSLIGGTLTQIAGSLISAFAGPLTGIFFLGCFFPRSNAKGTIAGGLIAMIYASWLSIGMNFSPVIRKTPWLPPASMDNCTADVLTNGTDSWMYLMSNYSSAYSNDSYATSTMTSIMTSTLSSHREPEGYEKMYTMSYLWISVLGTLITVIIGLIVSAFTGMNKPGDVDPRYLISVSESLLIFLPGPVKKYLSSIGPQFMKEEYKKRFPDPANRFNVLDAELEVKVQDDEKLQNEEHISNETNLTNGDKKFAKYINTESDDVAIEESCLIVDAIPNEAASLEERPKDIVGAESGVEHDDSESSQKQVPADDEPLLGHVQPVDKDDDTDEQKNTL